MRTTELEDIVSTVEQLRKELHPDLDPRFLSAVIDAEKDNPEDDAAAVSTIEQSLRLVLAAKGGR